jgi:hypothetical protein
MVAYNDARDTFQKATLAGARKCAPCEYATAEAYLALADHEVAEKDEFTAGHLKTGIGIAKEKSLEAIKLCEKPNSPEKQDSISAFSAWAPCATKRQCREAENSRSRPGNGHDVRFSFLAVCSHD